MKKEKSERVRKHEYLKANAQRKVILKWCSLGADIEKTGEGCSGCESQGSVLILMFAWLRWNRCAFLRFSTLVYEPKKKESTPRILSWIYVGIINPMGINLTGRIKLGLEFTHTPKICLCLLSHWGDEDTIPLPKVLLALISLYHQIEIQARGPIFRTSRISARWIGAYSERALTSLLLNQWYWGIAWQWGSIFRMNLKPNGGPGGSSVATTYSLTKQWVIGCASSLIYEGATVGVSGSRKKGQ